MESLEQVIAVMNAVGLLGMAALYKRMDTLDKHMLDLSVRIVSLEKTVHGSPLPVGVSKNVR